MEYNADTFEAQLAGTADFIAVSELLTMLQISTAQTHDDLAASHTTGRLPDDLPQFIVSRALTLAQQKSEILKAVARDTHWFDTHPSDKDRLKNIERIGAPGVIDCDLPAATLFTNFTGLCREASEVYYRSVLRKDYEKVALVETDSLVRQQADERAAINGVVRYFQGRLMLLRPLLPPPGDVVRPTNHEDAVEDLKEAREQMVSSAKHAEKAVKDFEVASANLAVNDAWRAIADANRPTYEAREALRRDGVKFKREIEDAQATVEQFETAALRRLTLALGLLHHPNTAALLGEDADSRAESVKRWMALSQLLTACNKHAQVMREQSLKLRVMLSVFRSNPRLIEDGLIAAAFDKVVEELNAIRQEFGATAFPFEHADQSISCADHVVPTLPDRDKRNIDELFKTVSIVLDRLPTLSFRVLAKFTGHADRVEAAHGMTPLPEPEEGSRDAQQNNRRDIKRYWFGNSARAIAGSVCLAFVIWMSISPPSLPMMPWDSGGSGGYRPASFTAYASTSALSANYRPSPPPGQPNWFQPGNPGYYQPGQPGHRSDMPTYWSPGYRQYYSSIPAHPGPPGAVQPGMQPPTYQPPTHQPPSYSPRPNVPSWGPPSGPPSGPSGSRGGSGPSPGGRR